MPLSPSQFRDLVSGRRRGLWPGFLRGLLSVVELPYTLVVRIRNRRYDQLPKASVEVGVPVVSVGNLTLGGTGKTPMVEWLARWFRGQDVRVAVISRGYGAVDGLENDEALQLEENLPDVPHLENRDRVAAAELAIDELATQLILLDDGFQHRRIRRDLDIVLLDALEPFGYDRVFPRGTLREPERSLDRAQVVMLSRANLISEEERSAIRRRVLKSNASAVWVEAAQRPQRLIAPDADDQPIESLAGQRIAAFCGIGHPEGFRRTLEELTYDVAGFRDLPDHHRYTGEDVARLTAWAEGLGVSAVVCTQKDMVKLRVDRLGSIPLWALAIELEITAGEAELVARLVPLAERARGIDYGASEKYW